MAVAHGAMRRSASVATRWTLGVLHNVVKPDLSGQGNKNIRKLSRYSVQLWYGMLQSAAFLCPSCGRCDRLVLENSTWFSCPEHGR